MKTLDEFISNLRRLNIKVWAEDNRLRYIAPRGTLSDNLLTELKERKAELLEFLSKAEKFTVFGSRPTPQATDIGQNLKKRINRVTQGFEVPSVESARTYFLQSNEPLPLVFEPEDQGANLASWGKNHLEFISQNLRKFGGIFFRNFDLSSVDDFEQFARMISGDLLEDKDRSKMNGREDGSVYFPVFGGIPPEDKFMPMLPLHNENSFSSNWPMKIWFYCIEPAQQDGETIIADSRKVFQNLDTKIKDQFLKKGVLSVQNYSNWEAHFKTIARSTVEDHCRRHSWKFTWKGGKRLKVSQVRPAAIQHPETQEMVWFNQAHLWHWSNLDPSAQAVLLQEFGEEDLPQNALYGDGTPIEASVIDEIREVFQQLTVVIPWKKGDVLMLDNMLVAHGRMSYVGVRKVGVAMAELYHRDGLNTLGSFYIL